MSNSTTRIIGCLIKARQGAYENKVENNDLSKPRKRPRNPKEIVFGIDN